MGLDSHLLEDIFDFCNLKRYKAKAAIIFTYKALLYSRTASDMDGTLHTDLDRFEKIRDIKKVLS